MKLVRLVEATYHGASIVRTTHGRADEFPIKVGLHQGSGLSPFLFIVVLDVISEEFRSGMPCELLFVDDGSSNRYRGGDAEEMAWLADWDREQGIKVNTWKTEVMVSKQERNKT